VFNKEWNTQILTILSATNILGGIHGKVKIVTPAASRRRCRQ